MSSKIVVQYGNLVITAAGHQMMQWHDAGVATTDVGADRLVRRAQSVTGAAKVRTLTAESFRDARPSEEAEVAHVLTTKVVDEHGNTICGPGNYRGGVEWIEVHPSDVADVTSFRAGRKAARRRGRGDRKLHSAMVDDVRGRFFVADRENDCWWPVGLVAAE